MSAPNDHTPGATPPSASSSPLVPFDGDLPFVFRSSSTLTGDSLRARFTEACAAWLAKSPSHDTRTNYARDVKQLLAFLCLPPLALEQLPSVTPRQVAAWRDALQGKGLSSASVRRKMTAVRSLFSYLQTYGYTGANPAHGDFVAAPAVPRDGKTVALSPEDCRRFLDAPPDHTPVGMRDRALLAVLAYTGCWVGELARLRVGSYKASGGHKVLEIHGKGGKERRVPLHPEAFERLEAWLDQAGIRDDLAGPLFCPPQSARSRGFGGFQRQPLTRRALQLLVHRYVRRLRLDPAVTVHSFRVTALTTARERGADIIDLQDFAGHAAPRTTLTYIRSRDRLSKSPAYALKY